MSFQESIQNGFSNYIKFDGRTGRQEWINFTVFFWVLELVLSMVIRATDFGLLGLINLVVFIPWLAMTARRFHDQGRSGAMALLGLIPVVGWIIVLIMGLQDGQPQHNQYGAAPAETLARAGARNTPQDATGYGPGGYAQPNAAPPSNLNPNSYGQPGASDPLDPNGGQRL